MPADSNAEWTPIRGLTRAVLGQLARLPLTLGFVAVLLWAAHGPFVWAHGLPAHAALVMGPSIAALAYLPSLLLARVILWRLIETLGVEGPAAALIGWIAACVGIIGGHATLGLFGVPSTSPQVIAVAAMVVETGLLVTWKTWVNPE